MAQGVGGWGVDIHPGCRYPFFYFFSFEPIFWFGLYQYSTVSARHQMVLNDM